VIRCGTLLLAAAGIAVAAFPLQVWSQAPVQSQGTVLESTPDVFQHAASAAELRGGVLAEALATVDATRIIAGQFTQLRTRAGLPKPIESQGEFLLVRDLGLQWRTTLPVQDEFVLRRDGKLKLQSQDRVKRPLQLGSASELLFALFSLDLNALDRRFTLYGTGSAKEWQVGLRPRDSATARAVRQAVVRGGEHVESISLVNGSGDSMQILIRDVAVQTDELRSDQRAIFE